MTKRFAATVLLSLVSLFQVDPTVAADAVEPPEIAADARNPPPTVALGAFQRFEVAPLAMGAPFTGYEANVVARDRLQANLDDRVNPLVAGWNAKAPAEGARTLKIEPEIRYVRFITGGKRFWGGAFAGGSAVLLKVTLSDAATGEVIADPDFYQHANALGAAWSFGGTDKHMLIRLSGMVADYLENNHATAVGGAVRVAAGHED